MKSNRNPKSNLNLFADWSCECGAAGTVKGPHALHVANKPKYCLVSFQCEFCGKGKKFSAVAMRGGKRRFCGHKCADESRLKSIPKVIDEFNESYIPEPNSGCWLWSAGLDDYGYGVISVRHRYFKATHLSLAIVGTPVTAGYCACHKCDVPACVNPSHLFLGTKKQNTHDARSKGRLKPRGVRFVP
jgi:hypothetical protein